MMTAILVILALALCGLAIAFSAKAFIKSEIGDLALIGLIVIPFLIYGLWDGRIAEFSGFGLTAKFSEAQQTSVGDISRPAQEFADDFISIGRTDLANAAFFQTCFEFVIVKPESVPTENNQLASYVVKFTSAIRSSISCGKFKGVVVLDDGGRYIGSYDTAFFMETVALWSAYDAADTGNVDTERLSARILQQTYYGASIRFPMKRIEHGEGFVGAINENESLLQTVQRFHELDRDFLVVTDPMGMMVGIVQYDEITQRLLDALTGVSEKDG